MANITQNSISKAKKVSKRIAKNSYNGVELPTNMAERRRLRNKLSAKIHRERKKDALEGVRREVFECDEELTKLKSELTVVSPCVLLRCQSSSNDKYASIIF